MATELAAITLACGKQDVHELDRTDLVAQTPQAAEITGLPLRDAEHANQKLRMTGVEE